MSITRTYSCLLFDLDGTLADTSEGIFNGLKYMMTKLGLKELGEDVLYSFLGPPLSESLYKAYGLTGKESDEAISAYREYYSGEGLTIYRQYPGLCDTIARLSQAGITLFVATSKPTPFAEIITEDMKISSCFKDIVGSNLDNTRINKTDIIRYILDAYALEKDECLRSTGMRNRFARSHLWFWFRGRAPRGRSNISCRLSGIYPLLCKVLTDLFLILLTKPMKTSIIITTDINIPVHAITIVFRS